ncbi:Uma2 family endonuclease [Streptomyces noursei]|uniref:Uma2 family endonuclease n=1 Tax=Streptomyces noursei TaxID=1971 RepID=UPI000C9A2500
MCLVEEDALDASSLDAVDSRKLLLSCEVVSPGNPGNDLIIKVDDYPRMGIPIYLLVDPRKATVTVYSKPEEGPDGIRYRNVISRCFGETVQAGQWTLDTTQLTRYSDQTL